MKEVKKVDQMPADLKAVEQVYLHQDISWIGVLTPSKNLHKVGHKFKNIKSMGLTKDCHLIIDAGLPVYGLVPCANIALALIEK